MKKAILTLSLFASAVSATFAQIPGVSKVTKALPKPLVGIKIGGNFNQLSTSASALAQNYKPSFLPGAFVGLRKGSWGIRVEGIINFAKYDYSFQSVSNNSLTNGTFSNVYLDIPVLLEYKIISRIWAQAGLQFSRTLSVKSVASGNEPALADPKSYFQPNAYSGVVGLEARLPVHLVLGARYILGFTDLNAMNTSVSNDYTNASGAWKARTAQIYVGFRFI